MAKPNTQFQVYNIIVIMIIIIVIIISIISIIINTLIKMQPYRL